VIEELRAEQKQLTEHLAIAGVQWLQFRVRGDFIGMRRVDAVIDEVSRDLTRVERKIRREEKRAGAA
jgi:hypothetical protein